MHCRKYVHQDPGTYTQWRILTRTKVEKKNKLKLFKWKNRIISKHTEHELIT